MADCCAIDASNQSERRLLWTVLILNGAMFFVEFIAGWLGDSSGLLADSLDMLADAAVYSVSLYAVGRTLLYRARAALLNGSLQLLLGLGVLLDVARRWWFGSSPAPLTMTSIGALALIVNITCFALLYRYRKGDINLRASWICSRNDMLANIGVIVAAVMVNQWSSPWPDWVIGTAIALLIVHSAADIIKETRTTKRHENKTTAYGIETKSNIHSCCDSQICTSKQTSI